VSTERRIETANGPVRIFTPDGYDPSRAGTCVYVHGWTTTVDEAWLKHRLPEKFAASRQNAAFIAVEAPTGPGQGVRWSSLGALLDEVERQLPIKCTGPVGAMVHSAGYRTLAQWLDDDRLVHATLLDALYGFVDLYRIWMSSPGKTANLLTATDGTSHNCEELVMGLRGVVPCADVPACYEDFTPEQRHAKTLYVRSRLAHMKLVEGAATIPVLLRRSPWEFIQ
jgi:hypothetical protein